MKAQTLMSFLLGGTITALTTYFLNTKIHSPPQNYVSLIACVPLGLLALFFPNETNKDLKGYLSSYAYVSFLLFLTTYFMYIIYNINPKNDIRIIAFIGMVFWFVSGMLLLWTFTDS